MNESDRVDGSWVNTIANDELLTFIFVDELSRLLWKNAYPDNMVWSSCNQVLVIGSHCHMINHTSVSSQTHNMLTIGKIKDLDDSCFFPWASCQEIISNKLQPETSKVLRFQFVYELFWNLANLSVSVEFEQFFIGFGSLFIVHIHIFIHIFIQVFPVLLFFFK